MTFDGGRSLSSGNTLAFSCAGSVADCGCVDVSGAISGPGGSRVGCGSAIYDGDERLSTSAEFDSSACLVQATVELETLREGGETIVNGGGELVFSGGGEYFLPSAMTVDLHVMSDAVVVCPQLSAELAGAVNVSSGGVLWFSGDKKKSLWVSERRGRHIMLAFIEQHHSTRSIITPSREE